MHVLQGLHLGFVHARKIGLRFDEVEEAFDFVAVDFGSQTLRVAVIAVFGEYFPSGETYYLRMSANACNPLTKSPCSL